MPAYRYTYTSFVDSAQEQHIGDIARYLTSIGGELVSVEVLDLSGTHFARSEAESITDVTSVLRVTTSGVIAAPYSSTEGEDVPWEGSAEEIVEDGSFASTDSWDIGFLHILTITNADEAPNTLPTPLLDGGPLPAPVRLYTTAELAALRALAALKS